MITAISAMSRIMPAPWRYPSYLGLIFFRVTASTAVVMTTPTIRPPSRAGMGSRFITARFTEMKATK